MLTMGMNSTTAISSSRARDGKIHAIEGFVEEQAALDLEEFKSVN
jgi:hypothetical protein